MKTMFIFFILIGFHLISLAENKKDWEPAFETFILQNNIEESTATDLYETLVEHSEHLFNLNTITKEELESLKFLDDNQIESIVEYVYRYKPIQTLSELVLIENLDEVRRRLLLSFLRLENTEKATYPSLKNIFTYGHHQAMFTLKIPFYTRKGDIKEFQGDPYKHQMRYVFRYGDYFKMGFTGAKDAGEPFLKQPNSWGYDHYSFFLEVKNLAKLSHIILGNYRIKTGMGLTLNSDFSLGKTMMLSNLTQNSPTFRAHSSTTPYNYFQGIAASIALSSAFHYTAFTSYRAIDATLTKQENGISNLLHTGLHRTLKEIERKNNVYQLVIGNNINFLSKGFHAGLTAYYAHFNKPFISKQYKIGQLYKPIGQSFYQLGVDYGYTSGKLTLAGETAIGRSGGVATIHQITWQPHYSLSTQLLHRYYSPFFYSLLGQSFSEGGHIQNENGLYLGIHYTPFANLILNAYCNYAYFPYPKPQAFMPSHAWDFFCSAIYRLQNFSFLVRYRRKEKQRNYPHKHLIYPQTTDRARLSISYEEDKWNTTSNFDVSFYNFNKQSRGWMFSQTGSYQTNQFRLFGSINYFHTNDFQSRIYTYERGLLYQFSFPMFYGTGFRYSIGGKINLGTHMMLQGKLGSTCFLDRRQISNGLQQINGNTKTDVELQMRYKF